MIPFLVNIFPVLLFPCSFLSSLVLGRMTRTVELGMLNIYDLITSIA